MYVGSSSASSVPNVLGHILCLFCDAQRPSSAAGEPRSGMPVSCRLVYARHGHELMGCKSPVGVPTLSHWTMTTTSRRQGRSREGRSGGSPSAKVRADEQKSHRRPGPGASQRNMYEAPRYTGQGECGGCAPKVHVLIRGDLPGKRPEEVKGAGLRPGAKAPEPPPDPTATPPAARLGAIPSVTGQKSAEAIVGARAWNGTPPKGRTR